MRDRNILIAVAPPAFERLIEHVLLGRPGFRVVGDSVSDISLASKAARFAPDVIIVSTRVNGKEHGSVLAALKRSAPASTLILLTHRVGESAAPEEADVCLPEEAVVKQLLPVIRKATRRAKDDVLTAPAGARH